MFAQPVARRLRIAGATIVGFLLLLILAALLLLSFGWGLLRPLAERRASAVLGRPVTIGRIERVSGGLFHPLLAIEEVRIAQPAWAGSGEMVRLHAARLRIAALPLLAGRIDPQVTLIDGLRAALIRDETGRANWERPGARDRGGPSPDLGALVLRDAVVAVDDRQHKHRFSMRVAIDAAGLRLVGDGEVGGTPARIEARGAPVRGTAPWPFQAAVTSPAVTLRAAGQMRTPLDFGRFTARVESFGRNLLDLDHIIQAGLFDTQPFRLTATITHDRPAWSVTGLKGTLGRSDVAGDVAIHKAGGRSVIDGRLVSQGFDFDDLATDAQHARAAAEARRLGPRLFPSTRIQLDKLRQTDGTLRIDIRHLLSRTPTVFRSLRGTLTLDHGVLTAPVTAGMAAGTLAGSLVVRHQSGAPLLIADLRLSNSRIESMMRTNGILSGPLAGRVVLRGQGGTVREAMAHADGRVALVMPSGTMTRRVALLLGADVGRGLFAGNGDRAGVRCLIGAFDVRGGTARPDPVVIDTDVARADGTGSVSFADERVALDLHGRPKRDSPLRLDGPIQARGTIEQATLNPPPQTKSVGGILKIVGKALGGHQTALAGDADCRGLAAHALR